MNALLWGTSFVDNYRYNTFDDREKASGPDLPDGIFSNQKS
jgi:hypothetical protein